ncbi:MAG: polyprenyl synthetase family protein [Pseudomonadota bacterium]
MEHIRAAVEREFEQVNALIIDQLQSDVAMVENVGHYIVDAGGKRLRPLLVLLCGSALGGCRPAHIQFAATVEFIHTATLLHDDVVDFSNLRRGRPTANAEFGNAPSVLVGDFLYTRAFQLMVQLGNADILRYMADTTNTIAEGEVLQLVRAGNPETSQEQYLDVITRKTAVLFAAGCHGAAVLADADIEQRNALETFGLNLGIAFQMIDDLLDYDGDPGTMGKNVGDDLTEGKVTLPLIYTLQHADDEASELVRRAIRDKSAENIDAVTDAVRTCGALDYTRECAMRYHNDALQCLRRLPSSEAGKAMHALTELAIERRH